MLLCSGMTRFIHTRCGRDFYLELSVKAIGGPPHLMRLINIARRPLRRALCTGSTAGAASTSSSGAAVDVAGPSSWTAAQRANEHTAARAQVVALFDWGKTLLLAYPMRANAVVSGTLCAAGDVLAQAIEMRMEELSDSNAGVDLRRCARMLIYGTCVCGPVLHLWYGTLALVSQALSVSYVPVVGSRVGSLLPWARRLLQKESASPVSPTQLLVAKVFADGLLFQAPFLNLYFFSMGVLEGRPLLDVLEKAKAAFHRAWGLSLLVWTPVQLVNLSLVPPPYQPLVVSAVNVGWKTTLSLLNAMHDTMHDATTHEARLRRRNSREFEEQAERCAHMRLPTLMASAPPDGVCRPLMAWYGP